MKVPAPVVAAALLVFAVSGCQSDPDADKPQDNGIATMSGPEAVEASLGAAQDLDDITYRVTLTEPGGTKSRGTTVSLAGGRCSVSTTGPKLGALRLRIIGRYTYVQVTPKLAMSAGFDRARARQVAGQWIRSRTGADELRDCRRKPFGYEATPSTFRGGPLSEIDGKPVRRFIGSDLGHNKLTFYIATTGEPVVVRAMGTDQDGPWRIDLAGTDLGQVLEAPDREDVIVP